MAMTEVVVSRLTQGAKDTSGNLAVNAGMLV